MEILAHTLTLTLVALAQALVARCRQGSPIAHRLPHDVIVLLPDLSRWQIIDYNPAIKTGSLATIGKPKTFE